VALVHELTIPTERPPLVGKLVPTSEDRGCCMASATDPHSRNLAFLYRNRYYSFQVARHLYSRGWVDPIPDPLFLGKSGSARNRIQDLWICSQELWPLYHRGSPLLVNTGEKFPQHQPDRTQRNDSHYTMEHKWWICSSQSTDLMPVGLGRQFHS
jgi:hypothetical protein